jgi:hypothetical protein
MGKNLEWQVAQGLLGTLYPLAGVALCERNTKVFANGLCFAGLRGPGDLGFGGLRESFEVCNAISEVFVFNARLKAEFVLDSAGECYDKIECGAADVLVVFLEIDELKTKLTPSTEDPPSQSHHHARLRGPKRSSPNSGPQR